MTEPRDALRHNPAQAASADDGAWFAAKRYGYGAGMPLRWQGWALLGGYFAALAVAGALHRHGEQALRGTGLALFVIATTVLVVVAARRTRGGWKWRWGA